MNRRQRLTDALIRRLKPGPREYTVRDAIAPSLGVRVHPSGGRAYVHFVEGRKVSLGPAMLKTVEEARAESRTRLSDGVRERKDVPFFGDFVAGPWRDTWVHRCKPSTIKGRDWLLENRLLPEFGGLRLDRITPVMVLRWFDDRSRTAPSSANHCLQTLRQILRHAVACGHVPSNPARGIRLNPERKITRFLSREELGRLHEVLDRRDRAARTRASQRRQIDIIRLLIVTGCRRNEILRLRRDEVAGTCLRLRMSKTGPRTVFLNREARAIIERRMAGGTEFLFPSPQDASRPLSHNLPLWYAIRREAGLEDVRLHDLRHTYASHAVMQGT
ncbi:MAG: tyrosine-type recombinase/integrase, partial [bacterium]|nr:tyrosine-type recombinase/integrase [bacterium]MDE0416516.1 tyrosine-type recombinase/integrase [bacterium]